MKSNYQFKLYYLILLSVSSILTACKSDKPENIVKPSVDLKGEHGVFVVNEGNFQFNNSSITYFNFDDKAVIDDIYKSVNQSALGDVCQSMTAINNYYYLLVNNSQKIEVLSTDNFKRVSTITGIQSPRYMQQVSSSKAYVSDYKSNCIHIIDLITNTQTGTIKLHGWTEEMIQLYGTVYVTNFTTDKLYSINAATDLLSDSLVLSYAPSSIVEDRAGKIWVLCQGDEQFQKNAALFCVNPISNTIEKRLDFSLSEWPRRLVINPTRDTLYYISKHVFRMPIAENTLPSAPFIDGSGKNIYGIGIDTRSGQIYISDAKDYIQKGSVYSYTAKGELTNTIKTGLIPSHFYFK